MPGDRSNMGGQTDDQYAGTRVTYPVSSAAARRRRRAGQWSGPYEHGETTVCLVRWGGGPPAAAGGT